MTVSPGYAWEIQTPEGGWGMESMLSSRAYALNGVLNGIDTQDWNPNTDKHIVKNYSISNFSRGKVSFGKAPNSECCKVVGMEGRRAPCSLKRFSLWQVYSCEQHGKYEGTECLQAENKAALQKELSLAERPEVPLIGFIGRLDYQKGADLVLGAVPWLMEQDVQLVCLGTGDVSLEVSSGCVITGTSCVPAKYRVQPVRHPFTDVFKLELH